MLNCVLDKGACCQFSSSTLFRKIKILHADKLLLISILLLLHLVGFFLFSFACVAPLCVSVFFSFFFIWSSTERFVSVPAFCPFCDLTALKLLELFPNKWIHGKARTYTHTEFPPFSKSVLNIKRERESPHQAWILNVGFGVCIILKPFTFLFFFSFILKPMLCVYVLFWYACENSL